MAATGLLGKVWPFGGRERSFSSRAPDGMVIYAIGDVHGRADLLERLLARIDADRDAFEGQAALVLLGDYVDRGPGSARVLDLVIGLDRARYDVRPLIGNHEQAMLEFLQTPATGPAWAMHGGADTLRSYGVRPPRLQSDEGGWDEAAAALHVAMPQAHLRLLLGLEMTAAFGDYFFCHAGARPGVPLERQTARDLMWIRDDFIGDARAFEKVVVHGHTPEPDVRSDRRRIGVDTGAYATGVLTAVRLEGTRRDFITSG